MKTMSEYKKRRNKRILKFVLALAILAIVSSAAYFAYLWFSYERMGDYKYLEANICGEYSRLSERADALDTSRAYNFMTWNIDHAVYEKTYSAKIEGGDDTWASSKDAVMSDICEIAHVINMTNPDFTLLQRVDENGTISRNIDEKELLEDTIEESYYYTYAFNGNSKFLPYPLYKSYGVNESGLITYAYTDIRESVRRLLPKAEGIKKILDVDRCYTVTKLMTDKDKYLCIYNVDLSGPFTDEELLKEQLQVIINDMAKEYAVGNYVVCGGDFNMDIKDENSINLPAGLERAIAYANPDSVKHESSRDASTTYNEETSETYTFDGFIVSENIRVNYYNNAQWGYEYSSHDPVIMQIFLE